MLIPALTSGPVSPPDAKLRGKYNKLGGIGNESRAGARIWRLRFTARLARESSTESRLSWIKCCQAGVWLWLRVGNTATHVDSDKR